MSWREERGELKERRGGEKRERRGRKEGWRTWREGPSRFFSASLWRFSSHPTPISWSDEEGNSLFWSSRTHSTSRPLCVPHLVHSEISRILPSSTKCIYLGACNYRRLGHQIKGLGMQDLRDANWIPASASPWSASHSILPHYGWRQQQPCCCKEENNMWYISRQ